MELNGIELGTEGVYFIAEAGVNHNGSLKRAEKLIDVAADSGADAVKFQTFSADRLVAKDTATVEYQADATDEVSQYEMLKQYELNREAHDRLLEYCEDRDITFLSTPFDTESADMLAELGVSAIKIGSGELDNHPLLEHVAALGLPMIVSTGMGTMEEVHAAHEVIRSVNPNVELAFLHCTSSYPCPVEDVNLRAMQTMMEELSEPVGYSDHTTLVETPAFAVAAGASILEKHFTLDSTLPGPDHTASLEPAELTRAVSLSQSAFQSRGRSTKKPTERELDNKPLTRKSLHAAVDISAGTQLTEQKVSIKRPADGLSPMYYDTVLGSETVEDIQEDNPIDAGSVNIDIKRNK